MTNPLMEARPSRMRNRHVAGWIALAISAAFYLILFGVYYPPTQGIEDEVGFINEALVFSRGAVTAEGAGYESLGDFRPYRGRLVGIRNPGRPLLTAPFVALWGLDSVFVPGALVHLGLVIAGALVFLRLGMSPLWAALILWHPTLSLYSRTVMGDTASGLCLLLALLALVALRRPGLWSGLAIGVAAIMRYQAGLVLPFFALALLCDPQLERPRREAGRCLLSGLAVGALIVAWNFYLYDSPTGIVKGKFGLEYLPGNVVYYTTALMLLWPLMLLTPFLLRGRMGRAVAAVCLPSLGFFLVYYFHDKGPDPVETLVVGQRLIQVALPAWIVGYAVLLDRHVMSRLKRWIPAPALVALVAVSLVCVSGLNAVMFARHERHLDALVATRGEIVERIPSGSLLFTNSVAGKLLGVPDPGLPAYRLFVIGEPASEELIRAERSDWFIAALEKKGRGIIDDEELRAALERHACAPFPDLPPGLLLYRCQGEAALAR